MCPLSLRNETNMPDTWFITGTSTGFGRAFAEYALDRGHNVVATARKPESLAALVARAPDRVLALKLDVTVAADATAAIAAAVARFGRIDVLINNAGYAVFGALEEMPASEWRRQFDTNFFGAIEVTRAALPTLRAQRGGAIVNIGSVVGQLAYPGLGAYSASKFALEGMSEALAAELAPLGIKVLIVEPGLFRTEVSAGKSERLAPIADYDAAIVPMQGVVDNLHGNQPGDPRKAAAAIERALSAEKTPLRLALGSDAVDGIRAHAEAMLADLAVWETVGRETTFN